MTGEDAARSEAGWADAMLAAALLAVDPRLGGAVVRAAAGPVRDAWLAGLRTLLPDGAPWRRLPLGIGDERLLGGLDIAAALAGGRRALQRGLLAEADGGVVVAPMAERLSPETAARLAAALDDGGLAVERDGLTQRLETRFVLAALDEGVEADEQPPAALTERLAFHLDLTAVGAREAMPIAATPADVGEARATLTKAEPVADAVVEALCGAASAVGIETLRAPLLALRVARGLAALEGRTGIEADDLATAARLVLAPRATRAPSAAPEAADSPSEDDDPDGGQHAAPDHQDRRDGETDSEVSPSLDDVVLDAVRAALPEDLAIWSDARIAGGAAPSRRAGAGAKQKAARRGRRVGVRPGVPRDASSLDIVETLKAAAPWQGLRARGVAAGERARLRVRRDDFRVRRFEQKSESTVIFVVDASGSSALQRLAEAKGAVELLLAQAYVRRTQVAVIAFRGLAAELLLPPTRSLARARRSLAELAGGGATPRAAARETACALAVAERGRGRTPSLVILTDGRGNIALDGAAFRTRAETDAMTAARRIRALGLAAALIDTSPRPRGEAAKLAEAMAARFAPLPYVQAEAVRDVARALAGSGK